ncbi:MAG: DEAD/DEAH box helicase family protein [Anaerolineae bacterium]|nr:DEAD/DEAH box helicase family protein [Anaerolineae bacterium]NUQ02587.1 DEAD/DEAH box helicase family protein [Anaerolineae bacterium]
MRGELVAIDLETTGFDPKQDEIIEIGAVRVVDGQRVEEFSTLVYPGRPVPSAVSALTGISNEDLIGAPPIRSVLPALERFVGTAPLLGHNVAFDANFLARQGLFERNSRIDTYELASVLLPTAPRYALSQLTVQFGFDIESAHRALYDARATAFIFGELWKRLLTLPVALIEEIVRLSDQITWDARPVFVAALESKLAGGEQSGGEPRFPAFARAAHPIMIDTSRNPIDLANLADAFNMDGVLARNVSGYERRSQQISMAQAVADALSGSRHTMIEAGTGTGKSLAYLIPSFLWAQQSGSRVVISTNTINLQDQLLDKDIPAVRQVLGDTVRTSVLKGRANYICPRQLAQIRHRRPGNTEELRTIAKVLVWLLDTTTGDRAELSLRGPEENLAWNHLSADRDRCTLEQCRTAGESCPFFRARQEAENAQIVIVNHALLMADTVSSSPVIPAYDYVIIDEAHQLEDAATNSLGRRLDAASLHRQINDLGDTRSGALGGLLEALRHSAPQKTTERFTAYVGDVAGVLRAMRIHVNRLFDGFRALLQEIDLPQETYSSTRVTTSIRSRAEFALIQSLWHDLDAYFDGVIAALQEIATAASRVEAVRENSIPDLVSSLASTATWFDEMRAHLNGMIHLPDPNLIYWLQVGQTLDYIALHSAPLRLGSLVRQHLWDAKRSVILTSATLRTNGDFKFFQERLGAESVEAMEIESPFDYKASTLLFLPEDMPDPNDKQRYQQQVERTLIDLTSALNGRVLALFTSYAHLRQTAQAITPRLALGKISVYDQSDGSSRQALLDGFRSEERAILMGTRSFWEGIDIPGEKLSALVILRLPFAVPTDPVFSARSETYHDAFRDYAMPDAIVRFRQGFGRLIRSNTDRGIVVILDSRIINKGYGHNFLEALPDCTIQRGLLGGLPEAAKTWLARN